MKFLCVCEGGTVRSGAMAHVLKYEHGQEAIAASWLKLSQETLDFLSEKWADRIILMQPRFLDKFQKHLAKIKVIDVGIDRWVNPLHPELMGIVRKVAGAWEKEKWGPSDTLLTKVV